MEPEKKKKEHPRMVNILHASAPLFSGDVQLLDTQFSA